MVYCDPVSIKIIILIIGFILLLLIGKIVNLIQANKILEMRNKNLEERLKKKPFVFRSHHF